MKQQALCEAAELLWRTGQQGQRIVSLVGECKPASLEEGYAIQAELTHRSGQPVVGWKLAATSAAGQAHIAVEGPIAGRLLADKVSYHPAQLTFGHNGMCVAEAEFAFRMGFDVPPREQDYAQDEVMACVASLHPAIEIPDSRFEDFTAVGGPQLAADNACAHRFVLGPEVEFDWRSVDLAEHSVVLRINGEIATRGRGSDALGNPCAALTWLANCAAVKNVGLQKGQIITTGVCGQPSPIKPGDRVVADFGSFGYVEARLA